MHKLFKYSLHFILLLTTINITETGKTQGYSYGGLGYNASYLKSEGLDFVIDRYNETRPYLTTIMPYNRYYDGITAHFGGAANYFAYDIGFTYRSSVVSASGIDGSGIEVQRDLKNKWNTWDFSMGINLGNSDTKALTIGINTALDSEKTLTRSDTPDKIGVANFAKVNSAFKIGFEPYIQLILATEEGFGILLKPYYSWTPVKTDYSELNQYINPYTYINDPIPIEGKLSGFGINIILIGYGEN